MILMAIQLFPPSTSRLNNRGASGRKSCGLLHPSSHTTLTVAAVTLASSCSSIKRSLILGHAVRSVSGYTKAKRYSVTIVFFRIAAWECVKRGSRSSVRDIASAGLITCGSVTKGSDKVAGKDDVRSYSAVSALCTSPVDSLHAFFSKFVANISTSVSDRKLCTAAR